MSSRQASLNFAGSLSLSLALLLLVPVSLETFCLRFVSAFALCFAKLLNLLERSNIRKTGATVSKTGVENRDATVANDHGRSQQHPGNNSKTPAQQSANPEQTRTAGKHEPVSQ